MFKKSDGKLSLQLLLAVCYCITGLVFFTSAIISLGFPQFALSLASNAIFSMIPGVSYFIFLVSGFILLMLAKERSDARVLEIQKSLKETESRFQQIVETAIEGILIFDDNYKITFANQNMASMLDIQLMKCLAGHIFLSFLRVSWMTTITRVSSKKRRRFGL